MAALLESDALHARVVAFIEMAMRAPPPAEAFDELALAIARFQAAHVPAIGRLARARGADLARARVAEAIPAVPCDVFRLSRIAAHPESLDAVVFRTSGTSQGRGARGEHPMRTTSTYERAALAWGQAMLFPDRERMQSIVLAPPAREAPDSSLSFMIDRFVDRLGGPSSYHVRLDPDAPGGASLDIAGLARACSEARSRGEPALVLGTSFAFVHVLDRGEGLDLTLPPGSRVMQTGGFKGRSREVEGGLLRSAIAGAFGAAEALVIGEYGMTELSSQLYEGTLAAALGSPRGTSTAGVFKAPPWVRVTAVDPVSLAPLAAGEMGLARIVDLANVDSAVAVQTSDRVRVGPDGVELFGRAPGATPRGCSLAMDAMLEGEPR